LFPEVGFKSTSFTDGEGEEDIIYILGGHILYSVYISIEGPIHWKETTGNDMASVNDIVEHYINKYIS
jgi:hypothetical protein